MQGGFSPSSLGTKEEEAYVKSLLEMSRSRRRKKKEELREIHNSLFHLNDDGNHQDNDEISPPRSSSRSRSTSPSFKGATNSSGSWGNGFAFQTSPEQQYHYSSPTICSEVRRVATSYAHEQHKQLSDDRSSYLLKRIDELKNMNIKAMIDHSFNASSNVTRDQSHQTFLSHNFNYVPSTSPTKSFPSPTNPPLSPHSKQFEMERRKRVEARNQEKLKYPPNTSEEKYSSSMPQQTPSQPLKRPSSARPSTQSQYPQQQQQNNITRTPEKSHQQNSILNNSTRKHIQHIPDVSKSPEKLTSPTKLQRPSSAPKSRVKLVETPKKTVSYINQPRVSKPPSDPFEREEKLILEQIQDLDVQLQKSVVFKSVVSSVSDLQTKAAKPKDNENNNSIVSNRVSRPATPSSSRRSNVKSPLNYSRCSNRPQTFETPKETSLEEIAKKNKERYGHIKSKVVSRRTEYSGVDQFTPTTNRNQRPASASRGIGEQVQKPLESSFSNTPKRPCSAPRKSRVEGVRESQNVRSVNISLKNILLEQEEYKRVWGEIEEEELRILKYTPKSSHSNNKTENPEKDMDISIVSDRSNSSFTNFGFDDNSESNFKNVMKKRIEEIEMGLKKIASLDPDDVKDDTIDEPEHPDRNETQDIESKYMILFQRTENEQPRYQPQDSSQLIEIDLEQSKISSCGEEDTTTIIEERVSNNIDAFLSHGESSRKELNSNESALSSSFIGDTSQIPSNPEFRKFINDKLDMLEQECSLHQ